MRLPPTFSALSAPRGLRRTIAAYFLDAQVEMAVWIAILMWAYAEDGAALAGIVAVVQLVPAALLAPVLAGLGDRMPRGTALTISHLVVAIGVGLTAVAILFDAPDVVVVGASTLATVAFSIVRPLHFAAAPHLARTPVELVSANALSSLASGIALFTGPLVAGVTAQAVGPGAVFAVGAALALLGAALCRGLGIPGPIPDGRPTSNWVEAVAGLTELWRQRTLIVILVMSTGSVVAGATDLLGVSISHEVLHLGDSGAGLIVGATGLGIGVGSLVAGPLARREHLAAVTVLSGVLMGVAIAVVALFMSLGPIIVALALAGAGGAVQVVAGRTLLQRSTDDRVLARVFGVEEGAALLALALGAALAPVFIEAYGTGPAFVPLGAGATLFTLSALVVLRRLDVRTVPRKVECELLRGVDFLAVLRPYELEQLARSATWIDAPADARVVSQGDPGDRFYLVAEGRLGVWVDGVQRPHVLGPGSSFGEIALVHRVPRTATVTTLTPVRLLAVDAPDFLRTVTGHPDGERLAADVARGHLSRDRQLPG